MTPSKLCCNSMGETGYLNQVPISPSFTVKTNGLFKPLLVTCTAIVKVEITFMVVF